MSDKHFMWLRASVNAFEAEALTITGIVLLWGWKAAAWAMLALAALGWITTFSLSHKWIKRGYDDAPLIQKKDAS